LTEVRLAPAAARDLASIVKWTRKEFGADATLRYRTLIEQAPDVNLSDAANDFQALERLRKLAFAETAPAPRMAAQEVLALAGAEADDDEEGR
jgi:plasmid stabilization system protein ParE